MTEKELEQIKNLLEKRVTEMSETPRPTPSISEKLNKLATNVKNLVYLLGIIATICGSVYITIDRTFESKVHELNATLNQRITAVEDYTIDQICKNILKQADKIKKGQTDDIKQADLEDGLKYFHMIKEPVPENVKIAYDIMKAYYIKTY